MHVRTYIGVADEGLVGADLGRTAEVLAAAIRRTGFDMVIAGICRRMVRVESAHFVCLDPVVNWWFKTFSAAVPASPRKELYRLRRRTGHCNPSSRISLSTVFLALSTPAGGGRRGCADARRRCSPPRTRHGWRL